MEKLEGLRETISLNKEVKIDGEDVVRLTADIHSDINSNITHNVAVINYKLYTENLDYCREQISHFKQVMKEREDFIINLYHPDLPEEEVVEEIPALPEPEEEPVNPEGEPTDEPELDEQF